MISWNHLYERATAEETRRKAVRDVLRGRKKMRNRDRYAANEEGTVKESEAWITNYHNARHRAIQIYDGISRKKRTIIVPTFEELTVQHCIIEAAKPMFFRGMYEHSYASIPGRGAHRGKKAIQKWIARDGKNCKYVLKMDIHHFFQSIPHDRLKARLRASIHDEKMLNLLFTIIDVTDVGLPLGFFTSQWLSNWYLQPLDHFIKEQCGAAHYIRYMDDMVVFGPNKKQLHRIRVRIADYLAGNLGLEMKSNWQVFRFDYVKNGQHYGRDLDFMGFRFFRDRTVLRRSIWYKCCRKARKIGKKERKSIFEIRQMLSYLGWIKATDVYSAYLRYVKPYVNFQCCKRRLSNYDRRTNNEMGNTPWNAGVETARN